MLLTNHGIDDTVVSPAEQMNHFVEAFRFPLLLSKVSPEARECRFRIFIHENGPHVLRRAHRVIACLRLPLQVQLETKRAENGPIFDIELVVKYTGA